MTTVLITGGHSGIGLAAVRTLAGQGVDVVLAGRSPDRMVVVADELRSAHGVAVDTLTVDTSSLASVRSAAARFGEMRALGEVGALDAILCNAGGRFDGDITYSADGYEATFATNYLGHFLLIELLMPHIADDGRVVSTVSGTHDPDSMDGRMVGAAVEPNAVALAHNGRDGAKVLSSGVRYATSKLCTVMHTYELDRRLRRAESSVSSIAFDPGLVAGTGFLRTAPRPVRSIMNSAALKWVSRRMGVTTSDVEFSGSALADIAVNPAHAQASGTYFQANDGSLSPARSSRVSYDAPLAEKLWEDSRRLVRLTTAEEPEQLR